MFGPMPHENGETTLERSRRTEAGEPGASGPLLAAELHGAAQQLEPGPGHGAPGGGRQRTPPDRCRSGRDYDGRGERLASGAFGQEGRGRESSDIQVRFSRFRGTVRPSPVQRQETQIVRSCKTLDNFLPGFRLSVRCWSVFGHSGILFTVLFSRRRLDESKQETGSLNGHGVIDDSRLWGVNPVASYG